MVLRYQNTAWGTPPVPSTSWDWGWKQPSLMGKIINISPVDYPMFTHSGNTRATDVRHYWQTRTLPDRDYTAITREEGSTFTYELTAAPSRVSNTCHILWVGAEVSGTAQEIQYHGIAKLLADQISYRSEQWKGACEHALIKSVETVGDTSGGSRRMDGLMAAITSNASSNGGDTLTELEYIQQLKAVWERGPKARHVMTNGSLRTTIDKFDAQGGSKWIATTDKEVVNMVLVYQSSFGTVQNLLSRDLQDTATAEMVALDFRNFHKAWLRPVRMTKPAIDGDFLRSVVMGELTLQYDDERAATKLTNILVEA